MPTAYSQVNRRPFFKDIDGIDHTTKPEGAIERYTFDWSAELESGETINSSSWTAAGLTLSGAGSTTITTYVTVTGTNGALRNVITTTGGAIARTLERTARISESREYDDF